MKLPEPTMMYLTYNYKLAFKDKIENSNIPIKSTILIEIYNDK